jgi:hypothetical protein
MSESTTAMTSSANVYTTREFWERLWRTAGLQFVGFFIISYLIYGNQPQVGASADSLVAFYHGDRVRILIAVVFAGLNVLNLAKLSSPFPHVSEHFLMKPLQVVIAQHVGEYSRARPERTIPGREECSALPLQ